MKVTRAMKKLQDAFLIHLANTHLKLELDKKFLSPDGREDYKCCEEFYNYQTLIAHLKESHNILQEW